MKLNIKELNGEAKIWVYTSSVKINELQQKKILNLADQFLSSWESHGKSVIGTVEIIEDHFVIIAADPKGDTLCGRAVDANVRFVKEAQQVTGLNLTDRMVVVYKQNGEMLSGDFNTLKKEIQSGRMDADSVIYNPLVTSVEEFNTSFEQQPSNCWLA
tara:strand:- start:482 stop:955 length:474 start_codon:yes stop_codon:yes gene_type:complete